MASLFSRLPQKSKSQMMTVLQELRGECFPSFAALPFLVILLFSLPVAIAPIWIAALPRPRFPSSARLSKKALPAFFLSSFLLDISPHPLSLALLVLLAVYFSLSPTLLSGKCRSFPDKFLEDWKRSKASGDHQESSAKKCVGMPEVYRSAVIEVYLIIRKETGERETLNSNSDAQRMEMGVCVCAGTVRALRQVEQMDTKVCQAANSSTDFFIETASSKSLRLSLHYYPAGEPGPELP
ncbi:hypothetical protein DPX16_17045 [Anabarilius grahami]|uniref:Uncharacterized protein n=1 Tax=Anabarilius grahami TaxID=495550 RepID=A0A3N0YAW8_ANAGA|nr:hypothetical protein DPX16_17045 [Anabarilius grahami]